MKKDIKKVLDAMIARDNPPLKDRLIFKEVYNEMDFSDIVLLLRELIGWQKVRGNKRLHTMGTFSDRHADRMILSGPDITRFKDFFRYTPAMSKIFKLRDSVIYYQEDLTLEEIEEIQNYVDTNYKIYIRGNQGGGEWF
jgi:hypothetical protein